MSIAYSRSIFSFLSKKVVNKKYFATFVLPYQSIFDHLVTKCKQEEKNNLRFIILTAEKTLRTIAFEAKIRAINIISIYYAMNKLISKTEAVKKIKDGMTVMIGGFLGHGSPETIIDELVRSGVKDLTLIVNDSGFPDKGCGKLVSNNQVKKLIVTHIGTNPDSGRKMNNGEMEIEFSPQGTLAERIRCGGSGLGGVLTPVGIGTVIEEGKQIINVDGKDFLLEKPLRADIALVFACEGDEWGNLKYKGTMENFNPLMAMAADTVIAEIEEVCPAGAFSPESIHTPHIFIDYIVNP